MALSAPRGAVFLPASIFLGSFAWSFVYVSLPFYIEQLSPLDAVATLRWTGWILGIAPLLTVLLAPLWGRMAGRGDARTLYVVVQFLQGLAFFGLVVSETLPELFLARFILGIIGAASTIAFVISGRAGDPREVRRQVAAVQSAMTVGQVLGPLAGALVAARLGFRPSFAVGGLILFACGVLGHWGLPPAGDVEQRETGRGKARLGDVASVALIVLAGSTQVFFLVSILPQVLPDLGVAAGSGLETGGLIIFASGAAAAIGSLIAPRLAESLPERTLLGALVVASSAFLASLALVSSLWAYGILRFLQVLAIAPVFPIVVARIAERAGGQAIGFINASRIGAAFVGPVLATTVLSWTTPSILYLVMALVGAACLPLLAAGERAPRRIAP